MELETAASTIEVSDSGIVIRWSDGARSRFHSLWLRDNCPTAVTVTELNPDVWVMDAFCNDDGDLEVEFSDGHETSFGFEWIRAQSHEPHDRRGRPRVVSHIRAGHELDRFDAPTLQSPEHCDVFESVSRFGAAVVTGAPELTGPLFGASKFSLVDQSHLFLVPHTSEPYRYVPPALTLLHPGRGRGVEGQGVESGGDVILVDGFGIAADLHDADPDVFDKLAETSIRFRDVAMNHVAHGPIISLDRDYDTSGIRFDEAAIAPLDLDPGMVGDYYRALIAFAEEVNNPSRSILLHLDPGEVLVIDNHRMLHGVSGFDSLETSVVARDVFHSELRRLRRLHDRPNIDERLPSGPRS